MKTNRESGVKQILGKEAKDAKHQARPIKARKRLGKNGGSNYDSFKVHISFEPRGSAKLMW